MFVATSVHLPEAIANKLCPNIIKCFNLIWVLSTQLQIKVTTHQKWYQNLEPDRRALIRNKSLRAHKFFLSVSISRPLRLGPAGAELFSAFPIEQKQSRKPVTLDATFLFHLYFSWLVRSFFKSTRRANMDKTIRLTGRRKNFNNVQTLNLAIFVSRPVKSNETRRI